MPTSRDAESAESRTPADAEALLESLDLPGAMVVSAGWTDGMRDFRLRLADGRELLFGDCLQASFHRPPGPEPPTIIGACWADEPSPLLLSLGPEIRFSYQHFVLELGDGLLRLAFRRVETGRAGADVSPIADR